MGIFNLNNNTGLLKSSNNQNYGSKSDFVSNNLFKSLIDQSGSCTPEQDLNKEQCLRELPAERYEVLEGENVQMRCRVAHQRGKAQWRARNFLLGYKRNIPGWPRYSMQGDAGHGVHDLLIKNVSRDDAGIFECQVSPVSGHDPLRRQTLLIILVKPTQPIILALPGEPQPSSDGQLIVALKLNQSYSTDKSPLHIICQAKGGHPKPIFEWYHNGNLIISSKNTLNDNNNHYNMDSSNEYLSDKNNVNTNQINQYDQFELSIDRSKLLTGDRLVCLVSNKATLRSTHLYEQKLRAEVRIVIHSPPGDPEIIDWPKSEDNSSLTTSLSSTSNLWIGSNLEATCRVQPAGNPVGQIIWRYEYPSENNLIKEKLYSNKNLLTISNNNNNNNKIYNTISNEFIINQITNDKILSKIKLSNLNASLHGLDLVCVVRHQIGPEKSVRKHILINHGPSSVDIFGPFEKMVDLKHKLTDEIKVKLNTDNRIQQIDQKFDNQIYIYPDRTQYMFCLTDKYYGQLDVKWSGSFRNYIHWEPIPIMESLIHKLETKSSSVNFIKSSVIQLVSTNSIQTSLPWAWIECVSQLNSSNPNEKHVKKRMEIKIFESPSKPKITGYKNGILLTEGIMLTLHCEAKEGNPPGKLIWTQKLINTNYSNSINHSFTEELINTTNEYRSGLILSTLNINLTKQYNEALIYCGSTNLGYPLTKQLTSDPIQINVSYIPTNLNISVINNTGYILTTTSSSSIITLLFENMNKLIDYIKLQNNLQSIPIIQSQSGKLLKLICHVELSNPKPEFIWKIWKCSSLTNYLNNMTINKEYFNSIESIIKSCEIHHLKGMKESNILNSNGQLIGFTSYLELQLNMSHNYNLIECSIKKFPHLLLNQNDEPIQSNQNNNAHNNNNNNNKFNSELILLSTYILLSVQFAPIFLTPMKQLNWSFESTTQQYSFNSTIPHYIVVEGGQLDLDLQPSANPSVTKIVWFKNGQTLISETNNRIFDVNNDNSTKIIQSKLNRRLIRNANLIINPIKRSDMDNYTLIATNPLGSTQFTFFLNVTYGPQLIGSSIINVTANGKKVELSCQSEANPTPPANAVRWRRLASSYGGTELFGKFNRIDQFQEIQINKQNSSQADSIAGIHCDKGEWHDGFKYFAKCWSPIPGLMSSTLTIYDLGPSDVGRYQCHMDNGIGSPAVRLVDLIYPFTPQIVQITRWSRAAANMNPNLNLSSNSEYISNILKNSHARLTCVIASEPAPEISWIREPANLTLVQGGQFHSIIKTIRPGLHHAILYLIQPQQVDLGRYYCIAKNLVGEDVGRVDLIEETFPDLPSSPRLINSTSTSLAVSWTQGFNGGPEQKFLLRWYPNEQPEKYDEVQLNEDFESEIITFNILGLQKATTYRIMVSASNSLSTTTLNFTPYLLASTTASDSISNKEPMNDEAKLNLSKDLQTGHWDSRWKTTNKQNENSIDSDPQRRAVRSGLDLQSAEDNAVVIIIAASVFGSFVLIANLLIILFLARNKRRKLNQQNRKVSGTGELMQLYPMENGFNEMHINPQSSFQTYPEELRLTNGYLLQSNQQEHFSPFQSDWDQIPMNMCAEQNVPILNRGNQLYSNSPHSSMKTISGPNFNSPNHLEFNSQPPSDIQIPPASYIINGSDMTAMTYLNTDGNNIENMQNLTDYRNCTNFGTNSFASQVIPSTFIDMEHSLRSPDRSIPPHPRINNVNRALTDRNSRNRSPNSGAASSISTLRSNEPVNTNSLERSASSFQRLNQHGNLINEYRQLNFGLTLPNGVLGPHILSNSPQQNISSFTTNLKQPQNFSNNWMISNTMTTSFDCGRTGSWKQYIGNGNLIGRNSFNHMNSPNHQQIQGRMNNSELSENYFFGYNPQYHSNKNTVCSTPLYQNDSPNRYTTTNLELTRSHLNEQRIDYKNLSTEHNYNENSTIPPPNDFQSLNQPIPYIQINSSTPTRSRSYYLDKSDQNHNNECIELSGASSSGGGGGRYEPKNLTQSNNSQINDQIIQSNYSSYGCVL